MAFSPLPTSQLGCFGHFTRNTHAGSGNNEKV
jgi:hypothetical protein